MAGRLTLIERMIVGAVKGMDKVRESTGFDMLDNPAINKYMELKEGGQEWDSKHPVGRVAKHLAIGTLRGLTGSALGAALEKKP